MMAALRLETADLSLVALDALDVDALAVPVGPDRPLGGLGAFADWRLCGAVSRAIRSGLFQPDSGEALLLPAAGRLAVPRVFCLGLAREPLDAAAFAEAARRIIGVMARAGSQAFATALPRAEPRVPAERLWVEAAVERGSGRQVLLGDGRALQKAFEAARDALDAQVEVVFVPPRLAVPPAHGARAAGLPARGAVVR